MKIIKVTKNGKVRYFSNIMKVSDFLGTRHSNILYAMKNNRGYNDFELEYISEGIDIAQIDNGKEYNL